MAQPCTYEELYGQLTLWPQVRLWPILQMMKIPRNIEVTVQLFQPHWPLMMTDESSLTMRI